MSGAKLVVLEDLIDSVLEEGKKLVIIARFIPELKAICRLLWKKGSVLLIMGSVKNRDEQVHSSKKTRRFRCVVGQIATLA